MFTYDELLAIGERVADARRDLALARLEEQLAEADLVARAMTAGASATAAEKAAKAGDDTLNALRRRVIELTHARDRLEAREKAMFAAHRTAQPTT